ncbi:RNA-directed DNA polymerase, eukaryota, reverse transcriptase zinc-binding domain protein [Tanacetum coccineum]
MTNKKKSNNRSNKRNIKLPVRYNDHIMSNLSQNRDNSEVNEVNGCFEEIRVHDKEIDDECVASKDGMLGGSSVHCNLNNKLNEIVYEESSSDKLNKECWDTSNKECLGNSDELVKDNVLENISYSNDNKQKDDSNKMEYSNGGNDETGDGSKRTYASAIKNSGWFESNKLFIVPTVLTELGDEVVVFDEELMELGSKKWELTLIPWMVNSKLLMVQKWDPSIGMTKTEPTKIPVWVKLTDVPMEAWTTKGISAISSSVGRPLIMDRASKGFKETVELQYMDKNMNVKGSKTVKVTYDRKPPIYAHCLVFGHDHKNCKVRARTNEEIATEKESVDKNVGNQKENEFGSKRFIGYNKQQWNKKVSNCEENNANKNKEKSTKEEIPVQRYKHVKRQDYSGQVPEYQVAA